MTRTSLRPKLLALALTGIAVLGACGDDDDDDAATDTSAVATTLADTTTTEAAASDGGGDSITIEGFAYNEVTVAPGATVSITNSDTVPHTVTADEDDAFDSGQIEGGATGSITAPSEPGTYTFHCEVHSSMQGTLTVA